MLKDEEEDDETYYSMMQRYTAAKLHTNTFQTSVAGLSLCLCVYVCQGPEEMQFLSLVLSFDRNLKGEDRVNT